MYDVNMTIKLKDAKRLINLHLFKTINNAISNSIIGTIQTIDPAKALNKGDCPNCTRKFSKSNNLLTAAYVNRTAYDKQIMSRMMLFIAALNFMISHF